jgi:hypothetical protein
MSSNILEDFVPEVDFARDNNIHPRTVARYRNQPDGLPYVEFGGKVMISVSGAREWLMKRVQRKNQPRSQRGGR